MDRNSIRTTIFNERVSKTIVELDNKDSVEVRDGSVGGMLDAVSVEDLKKRMARMLISCCYVPNTDIKIFEEADFDSLMDLPSNGSYKKIMDAINHSMNLEERKAEEGKG